MAEAGGVKKWGTAWLPSRRTLGLRTRLVFLLLLTVVCFLYLSTSIVQKIADQNSVFSVFELDNENTNHQPAPGHASTDRSSRLNSVQKATSGARQDRTNNESANSSDGARETFWNCGRRRHSDNTTDVALEHRPGFPDQCKGPGLPEAEADPKVDLTRLGPFPFVPGMKNPCWRSEEGGRDLRCLPYAYLAGFPKCGSTDLYERMVLHPEVAAVAKEPHWITRFRLRNYKVSSFENYSRLYGMRLKKTNGSNTIAVDGSASTAWDNDHWYRFPGNQNCSEPCVLNADYIRHLNPKVKIIMILRNPTSRLYSDYMYFARQRKMNFSPTPEKFHQLVQTTINKFEDCLKHRSLRHCAYNTSVCDKPVRLGLGLYTVFIEDWFLRYPRDQIHVVRLEEMTADPLKETVKVYKFLGLDLDVLTAEFEEKLRNLKPSNVGRTSRKKGPMLSQTRTMLDSFYAPYNRRLATVLGDAKYTWTDV